MLIWVYICQNGTLLEITYHGSMSYPYTEARQCPHKIRCILDVLLIVAASQQSLGCVASNMHN